MLVALSRRHFLGLSLRTGLLAGIGIRFQNFFSIAPGSSKPTQRQTLRAYLDTLIPADETPSATQLDVAEKIMAKAATDRGYERLIKQGCDWMDKQAKQYGAHNFSDLSEANREHVVSRAAEGEAGILPLMFFERTRADALFHYYGHPQSWRALGYAGPPQPGGFMNYAEAPTRQLNDLNGLNRLNSSSR
jgi:hypothetical protein